MSYLEIKNWLYRTKLYWVFKKWFEEKPVFSFWKTTYQGHINVENHKKFFYLLLPSLPMFLKTVVYAAVIIVILQSYNYFYPTQIKFDGDAVDTLLAAIASIAGVFLGLYFTAISSIASNFLIRATQDVRRFFLSAPEGRQYVQTIALTGIISVFYIATKSFGITIHPVGIIFLSLITVYIVIRFWTVGSNVFNSLEPTDSMPWISRDIANSIRNVTPPEFQWNVAVLQNHQKRLGTTNLQLIDNLIHFGIKEIKLSDEQLITAINYLAGLLSFYSAYKSKIPQKSLWYKTKNQFQNWTLADSVEISVALNTGTTLHPKAVNDFTWFEEQILDIGMRIFKHFNESKRIGSIYQGYGVFVNIAEIYGKDFDVQALKILFKKNDEIINSIGIVDIDITNPIIHKECLALMDAQGTMATVALLGLTKYLNSQSGEGLAKIISKINWVGDDKSIYLTGLPLGMLDRLESTAQEIKNERIIEGHVVAQVWYIESLCIQRYLFALKSYFDYIKSLHKDYFQQKFDKLVDKKRFTLAAQFILRWVEFSNKYQSLVGVLRKHVEDCNQFHQLKDLPWPNFDFSQDQKDASDRAIEVADKMIELLPKFKNLAIGDDLPDYFGQALTIGVEACFNACDNNNQDRFNKIFPFVFEASMIAHDITRQKVENWSQEDSKIIYTTEPLINLFELTGYAKLYAELYQNQGIWNAAQQVWDKYISTLPNAEQMIKYIAAMVAYRDGLFMIMPQATLRANWQIDFGNRMRERGLPVFPDHESYDVVNRRRSPNHPSPLIRVMARMGGLAILSSAQNIFFLTYLSNLPVAAGIEFKDRHNLREKIQEEQGGE